MVTSNSICTQLNFIQDYLVSPSDAIASGRKVVETKSWPAEPSDTELNSPEFQSFVSAIVDDALNGYNWEDSDEYDYLGYDYFDEVA
jgi:hypothetical protein